jgi:thiol:disulfide interchange protein DsbD
LGFLELALAFKFLSGTDLVLPVYHRRGSVLGDLVAIFWNIGPVSFFGKITMPHDSPLPFYLGGKIDAWFADLVLYIYMVPGLWGAPLKLINAFPPPMGTVVRGIGGTMYLTPMPNKLPEGAKFGPA